MVNVKINYCNFFVFILAFFFANINLWAQVNNTTLSYPFYENKNRAIFMRSPSNIFLDINYDLINNQYIFQNKIGSLDFGKKTVLNFNQYQQYTLEAI